MPRKNVPKKGEEILRGHLAARETGHTMLSDLFYSSEGRVTEEKFREVLGVDPTGELLRELRLQEECQAEADLRCFLDNVIGGDKDEDSYEDPDQSHVRGREATVLRCQWAGGYDYTPSNPRLSEWFKLLWRGDYTKMLLRLGKVKDKEEMRRLVERRESGLRLSSIFHPIEGARAYHCKHPTFQRLRKSFDGAELRHMDCLKKLVELGANIHAHDVAGYTAVHHCLTMYGGDETMAMARLLLEQGADPNARNRFGGVPLLECVMHKKVEFIQLLLEFGADPAAKDSHGMSPQILAANSHPIISTLINQELKKRCRLLRSESKKTGGPGACLACGSGENSKRCSGCLLVRYCSKQCQEQDWNDHQKLCKEIKECSIPVELDKTEGFGTYNYLTNSIKMPSEKQSQPSKRNFVVKIQVPVSRGMESLLVYNEERSVMGQISPSQNPEFFALADEKIRSEGFNGNKGYFYATWSKKKGLRINPHTLLPLDRW